MKDTVVDNNGQREFYFRDLDGYVIGINDRAALQASDSVRTPDPGMFAPHQGG